MKHGCPRRQQIQTLAKFSTSYILTLPYPQGHLMSLKCEQPLDELTVQVWLLYDHPNFKYCTLFISGTELRRDGRTDGRTDRQTGDPNTRCPRQTFQAGGIKTILVASFFILSIPLEWIIISVYCCLLFVKDNFMILQLQDIFINYDFQLGTNGNCN